MSKTLLARLQQMHQFDPAAKTINWQDPTQSRWSDIYGSLQNGDSGLFLSGGRLLFGTIEAIEVGHSILFGEVKVCNIKNDDFLKINAAFPEKVARVKASFQPFVPNIVLDAQQIFRDAQNKNFISFYVVREEGLSNLLSRLKEGDRVIELEKNKFKSFSIYSSAALTSFKYPEGLFRIKGQTLSEILAIQAAAGKTDAQKIITDIGSKLDTGSFYQFPSFHQYYMVIHNKRVYSADSIIDDGGVDDPEVDPQPNKETVSSLNTILFGPPGTGKTYHTIDRAVSIVNPGFVGATRQEIKDEYERLVNLGRIAFCTFHQSMSYEDFIEGIKPVLVSDEEKDADGAVQVSEKGLRYQLVDGIFKRMCQVARFTPNNETAKFSLHESEFDNHSFFKISLGRASSPEDDIIYDYCIKNNYIALGWGNWIDYSGKTVQDLNKLYNESKISDSDYSFIKRFLFDIKEGDYVVVSEGNYWCRAIGKVTGEYEYDPEGPNEYLHFRKVEWLITDVKIPVEHLYDRLFMMKAFYKLDKSGLKKEFFVKDENEFLNIPNYAGNYVLIIDEISRGNVSQIFGELITLIEDTKREGMDDCLEVLLPYSNKKFSVPSNLYIVATMNTADRSVEALDTALRRRFEFKEMQPSPTEIRPTMMGKVNLVQMLETINQRLKVLLDKDRTIGHAWLMNIDTIEDLKDRFKHKIIPLLEEFFYSQPEKIGLVLGKAFVKRESTSSSIFADFDIDLEDYDLDEVVKYRVSSIDEMDENAFISIYDAGIMKSKVEISGDLSVVEEQAEQQMN